MTFQELYTRSFISNIITICGFILCYFLTTISYKKKKNYWWLQLMFVCIGGAICALLPFLQINHVNYELEFTNIAVRLTVNIIILIFEFCVIYFSYDESNIEKIIGFLFIRTVDGFTGTSFSLFLNLMGIDDTKSISLFPTPNSTRDYFILGIHHVICYLIFAYIFYKRRHLSKSTKSTSLITGLLLGVSILSGIIGNFARIFTAISIENGIVTKTYQLIVMGMTLFLIFVILHDNKVSMDLEITKQLLYQEKKDYEISKSNVESINSMVHDFKHTLHRIEDKLNEEELEKIKKAIQLYDSNIKTGNPVLDTILYEKQLECNHNKISLSCMANGTLLTFMSPSHLYSLFGNAIDNAIEAVLKIDNEKKRRIGISISRELNNVRIEINNYFIPEQYTQTSKKDKNRHGYGMKSMEYIVSTYHGKMEIDVLNDIYTIIITLPIKSTKAE